LTTVLGTFFEHALPVLQAHGFRAVLFLVSDLIGKTNEWQQREGDVVEPLMDAAEVRAWIAAGQAIGAHTRTHPWLTRLALAAAREEITASKKKLEDAFAVPVEHFCYPYGDWNATIRDLVIAAGYRTACTTEAGVNFGSESVFELKRITARYPTRSLKAVWARLRGPG
jgi:peptidoglycan/xylan/chitin deacetylase (PgdA/CDA1 family)